MLHSGGGEVQVRRDVVDVQFDGVRAGLLHLLGVIGPATGRGAVEAGDDGNLDGGLGLADVLQIHLRANGVIVGLGEIGE